MITSFKARGAGYITKLPAIGRRQFTFGPGVTVLLGENMCGKTSLLSTMASYCCCPPSGGWSAFVPPLLLGQSAASPSSYTPYPQCLDGLYHDCEAAVEWDGSPAFFYSADSCVNLGDNGSNDGVIGAGEGLNLLWTKPSSGGRHLYHFNKMLETLSIDRDGTPNKHDNLYKQTNDNWRKAIDMYRDFLKTKPRNGPPTIFMDEPERSVSLYNQVYFWTKILPLVAQDFQVIIATHSVFALGVPGARILEMTPGFAASVLKSIRCLAAAGEPNVTGPADGSKPTPPRRPNKTAVSEITQEPKGPRSARRPRSPLVGRR